MRITLNLATRPSPISVRPSSVCASAWLCSPRSASSSSRPASLRPPGRRRPAPASTRSTAESPASSRAPGRPGLDAASPRTRNCSPGRILNELFDEKAFSWTLAMEAMETVLPAGVQVTSIEPIRAKDGHITVHLRVLGPTIKPSISCATSSNPADSLSRALRARTPSPATAPTSARSPSAPPTASTSISWPITIRPRRKNASPQ